LRDVLATRGLTFPINSPDTGFNKDTRGV
jgi:hypothetical protein